MAFTTSRAPLRAHWHSLCTAALVTPRQSRTWQTFTDQPDDATLTGATMRQQQESTMSLFRATAVSLSLAFLAVIPDYANAQPGRGNGNDKNNRGNESRGNNGRDNGRDNARTLFTWSGNVDREVLLVMQGRELTVRGERGILATRTERPRASGALPRTDGFVRVRMLDGRGDVDVIQQPTSRNNYTTIVRVRDPRSGDDRYRLTASWEPDSRRGGNDSRNRDGDWGRGDDRRDDRRDDRDDDRNGPWDRNDRDGRNSGGVRWSGLVDDDVELRIRGRRVDVVERSGVRTRDTRSTFSGVGLPRESGLLRVVYADGRGNVSVAQQPAPWNEYTGVVRVRDPRGGAARYDIDIRW
jgi:hypothetical protein